MRAVLQRVARGRVTVDERTTANIGPGLVILLGVGPADGEEQARYLARKVAMMRIFPDDAGKMNLSLQDISGEAIVVSQFTLFADTRKGHRPSFVYAAPPETASPLVDQFVDLLRTEHSIPTQTGEFGAHMIVEIINDGPVTIWLDTENK